MLILLFYIGFCFVVCSGTVSGTDLGTGNKVFNIIEKILILGGKSVAYIVVMENR